MDTTTTRLMCDRCQRPLRACLCTWIRPTHNRVPVLLLQHPAEAGHAKGSARLLRLSLLDCDCAVGETFDALDLSAWLVPGSVLLYPHTPRTINTPTTTQGEVLPPEPVRRLVVLDGTWRQSRQLLRLNPRLQALPRLPLQEPPPSQYAVRKAQSPWQRSTLEATCLALGHLEARPAHYAPLLQGFAGWVQGLQTLQADPLQAGVPDSPPKRPAHHQTGIENR